MSYEGNKSQSIDDKAPAISKNKGRIQRPSLKAYAAYVASVVTLGLGISAAVPQYTRGDEAPKKVETEWDVLRDLRLTQKRLENAIEDNKPHRISYIIKTLEKQLERAEATKDPTDNTKAKTLLEEAHAYLKDYEKKDIPDSPIDLTPSGGRIDTSDPEPSPPVEPADIPLTQVSLDELVDRKNIPNFEKPFFENYEIERKSIFDDSDIVDQYSDMNKTHFPSLKKALGIINQEVRRSELTAEGDDDVRTNEVRDKVVAYLRALPVEALADTSEPRPISLPGLPEIPEAHPATPDASAPAAPEQPPGDLAPQFTTHEEITREARRMHEDIVRAESIEELDAYQGRIQELFVAAGKTKPFNDDENVADLVSATKERRKALSTGNTIVPEEEDGSYVDPLVERESFRPDNRVYSNDRVFTLNRKQHELTFGAGTVRGKEDSRINGRVTASVADNAVVASVRGDSEQDHGVHLEVNAGIIQGALAYSKDTKTNDQDDFASDANSTTSTQTETTREEERVAGRLKVNGEVGDVTVGAFVEGAIIDNKDKSDSITNAQVEVDQGNNNITRININENTTVDNADLQRAYRVGAEATVEGDNASATFRATHTNVEITNRIKLNGSQIFRQTGNIHTFRGGLELRLGDYLGMLASAGVTDSSKFDIDNHFVFAGAAGAKLDDHVAAGVFGERDTINTTGGFWIAYSPDKDVNPNEAFLKYLATILESRQSLLHTDIDLGDIAQFAQASLIIGYEDPITSLLVAGTDEGSEGFIASATYGFGTLLEPFGARATTRDDWNALGGGAFDAKWLDEDEWEFRKSLYFRLGENVSLGPFVGVRKGENFGNDDQELFGGVNLSILFGRDYADDRPEPTRPEIHHESPMDRPRRQAPEPIEQDHSFMPKTMPEDERFSSASDLEREDTPYLHRDPKPLKASQNSMAAGPNPVGGTEQSPSMSIPKKTTRRPRNDNKPRMVIMEKDGTRRETLGSQEDN